MSLPVEIITYAIRSTESPEKAAELIHKYEDIRNRVEARKKEVTETMSNAKKKAESLMKEQLCQHEVIKRLRDPSGGSDREEQCLICGEYLYQKEPRFT